MSATGPVNHRARLLGSLALGLLLLGAFEGVYSLSGRGSLYRHLRHAMGESDERAAPVNAGWMPLSDLERQRAAVSSAGLYRLHPDPRVGSTLRTDAELSMYDVPFRTDSLGLRCRPRTRNSKKEPDDALRIVVVGASIPFGIALKSEQVTAHILERLLQERSSPRASDGATTGASESVTKSDVVSGAESARPIVCRSVAVPRWGHRNAVLFLLDHWDELRPDIVIYLPVGNDTSDTLIVDESGHRRDWPDSSSRFPKITISDNATVQLLSYADLLHRTRGDALPGAIVGAHALRADLGQESIQRYEDAVSSLERLAKQVERKGARLLVARYHITERMDFFFDHVAQRGLRPEVLGLFQQITPGMTLGFDPHPNADGHLAMATLMAQKLVALGWVETTSEPALPELSGLFAENRSPPFDWDAVAARARDHRRWNQQRLRAVIEPDRGEGLAQIYGGMSPEGTVGSGLLTMLGLDGPTITVRLRPISTREDLYPIDVTLYADGLFVGQLTLASEGPTTAEFPVPEALRGNTVADIELRPEHWGVLTKNGRSVTASFRLEHLSCGADR